MIELKSAEQIEKIRRASKIVVEILKCLKEKAHKGVKTEELNGLAAEIISARKAKAAFLGYRGFPKAICTSLNEEVVHGIPGEMLLCEGDVLSVDVGVELDGYFADGAVTVGIGRISAQAKQLIDVTKEALFKAIEVCKEGNRIYDISSAVQGYAESFGFSVIREFVGHGIGLNLHEDPQIPNFGTGGMGIRIKEGMVFAIEPMVSAGRWEVEILKDGWTAVTRDRSLTAHFEHTVAITREGTEVLTEGIV